MAAHSYASAYPADLKVDPAIKSFFEEFYKASDSPETIESYADFFTDDASLTMASSSVKGKDEIITLRKGMWAHIGARKHTVPQIFPFGNDAEEAMLQGSVDFTLINGKELSLPWGGYAKLVKADGSVKMSTYQVYIDMAPVMQALM
ncbi:putative fungal specific transcription [Phaeomoniella chlamydospora]|uniref:Putative fungal specific transcription n=1 Tax=Phaeomoniella chlamydospora TaxID=158046 RepID=A0A0G2GIL4_PHACM|nr:putative fungal specific transcription [Phaeomoniella chlamydospora]